MTDGLHRTGTRPLFDIARSNRRSATRAERAQSESSLDHTCRHHFRTVLVAILVGIAASFVSVAVGILVWDAIEPTSTVGQLVPVLVGGLVAVGGGIGSAYLVPWLLAGGFRLLVPTIQRSTTTTETDERPCRGQDSELR